MSVGRVFSRVFSCKRAGLLALREHGALPLPRPLRRAGRRPGPRAVRLSRLPPAHLAEPRRRGPATQQPDELELEPPRPPAAHGLARRPRHRRRPPSTTSRRPPRPGRGDRPRPRRARSSGTPLISSPTPRCVGSHHRQERFHATHPTRDPPRPMRCDVSHLPFRGPADHGLLFGARPRRRGPRHHVGARPRGGGGASAERRASGLSLTLRARCARARRGPIRKEIDGTGVHPPHPVAARPATPSRTTRHRSPARGRRGRLLPGASGHLPRGARPHLHEPRRRGRPAQRGRHRRGGRQRHLPLRDLHPPRQRRESHRRPRHPRQRPAPGHLRGHEHRPLPHRHHRRRRRPLRHGGLRDHRRHAAAASSTSRTTSRCATWWSTTAPPRASSAPTGARAPSRSSTPRSTAAAAAPRTTSSTSGWTRTTIPTASSACSTRGSTTAIGGNNVKSRSARNEIYYNRIEGAYYHEIELIGAECCAEDVVREDSDVVGNLFVKKGANANFAVTRFGGDGTAQTWGRYRFVNNTVVVTGTAAVFRLFDGLESVEMHNNVFYRSGGGVTIVRTVEAVWASGERFAGSNNWISTGSTSVPTPWTGTITGSNPGFTNAAGGDYSPAAGSPLLNAGNETLSEPRGLPLPRPPLPARLPPAREPRAPSAPRTRDPTTDRSTSAPGSAARAPCRSSPWPTSP